MVLQSAEGATDARQFPRNESPACVIAIPERCKQRRASEHVQQYLANTWQGNFPNENLRADGWARTSPVHAFPPNGYGVHDMIGNVWEWTTDWYSTKHKADAAKACCVPMNPRGAGPEGSYDPCQTGARIPRKVLKGGSHLCAPNYCRRYRPAARHAEDVDTSTSRASGASCGDHKRGNTCSTRGITGA